MRKLSLASLTLILASCAGRPVISPAPNIPSAHIEANAPGKLILASPDLHGHVALVNPKTRSLGQLTQAEVGIQNTTDDRYTVEYRFEWFDKDHFAIQSLSTWHRLTLTAGELRSVQSLGKNPSATNFQFTVRLPDDVFIEHSKSN